MLLANRICSFISFVQDKCYVPAKNKTIASMAGSAKSLPKSRSIWPTFVRRQQHVIQHQLYWRLTSLPLDHGRSMSDANSKSYMFLYIALSWLKGMHVVRPKGKKVASMAWNWMHEDVRSNWPHSSIASAWIDWHQPESTTYKSTTRPRATVEER